TVGRIGEIDRLSIGTETEIVGTVEPLALIVVDEGALAAALGQDRETTIPVFTGNQLTLSIDEQAVATRFSSVILHARVAGRLHPGRGPHALLPTDHAIVGDVGKKQVALLRMPGVLDPHGALCPGKSGGQHL